MNDIRTIALIAGVLLLLTVATAVGQFLARQPDRGLDPAAVNAFNLRLRGWWIICTVLAAAFWLIAAAHQADIHIIRVPSKSNPADAPSRGEQPPRASRHNQQPPTWIATAAAFAEAKAIFTSADAGQPPPPGYRTVI